MTDGASASAGPPSPADPPVPVPVPPALAERRLIFCINSGRCGSKYLAELLGTAAGVRSFHEAPPPMSGAPLHLVNAFPFSHSRAMRRVKCQAIADILSGMAPHEIYAETNHMFIKTFFDVVAAEFENVDVVLLRRRLPLVLKSFVEMGYYSPLNPGALDWMSSPNAVTAALRPVGPDAALDPYDASIAYLFDIEARAQRFIREYPRVRVHEARLEALLTEDGVAGLLARLRVRPTERTREVIGRVVNDRPHRKRAMNNPTTIRECQRRLQEYVTRATAAGIEIPRTAALA